MKGTISNQEAQLQAMQAQLDESFAYVRKTFFSRWDRKHQWSCAVLDGTGQLLEKPIGVWHFVIAKGRDQLEAALIIEICHAMTRGRGHPAFLRRLRTARSVAEHSRRRRLGGLLGIAQFYLQWLDVGQQHGLLLL